MAEEVGAEVASAAAALGATAEAAVEGSGERRRRHLHNWVRVAAADAAAAEGLVGCAEHSVGAVVAKNGALREGVLSEEP